MNYQNKIITKTIDGTTFMGNSKSFMLQNAKNNARINIDFTTERIIFYDSFGNIIQNCSSTIIINSEIFNLTALGQTINRNNGNIITYLSSIDVQELAEKTFYEEGQTRVYDFINLKFNIEI